MGSADKLALGTSEAQRRLSLLSSRNPIRSNPRNHGLSSLTALSPTAPPVTATSESQYPPTTRPLPPRPTTPSPPVGNLTASPAVISPPQSTPVAMPQQPLPAPSAAPQSPRTTRRQMLAAELPEDLRKQLLWERMSRQRILGGGMINRSNSTPKLATELAGPRPSVVRSSATEGHNVQSYSSDGGLPQPPVLTPLQSANQAGIKRTGGVLNTNTLRPLTSTQGKEVVVLRASEKRPSFGDSQARPNGLQRVLSRPFHDDSSDSEDENKMDPATVLKRRNTHHGALDRMMKDDGCWDADYRSHGCQFSCTLFFSFAVPFDR